MANIRRFCCDDETGEIMTYKVNEETGEPFLDNISPLMNAQLRQKPDFIESNPKYNKFPRGITTKTRKFKSLKANIIAGSNAFSHRVLLIPTVLMIFPGFLCVMLTALEVFLHVRCHKKNKNLKDPDMYYRSPFHMVTSVFCGACRDHDTASKMAQLQDKRRFRYDYFRGIGI